jgi:hypothetical protein
MAEETKLKLGADEWHLQTPVRYHNVYSIEQTAGPERLIIGPAADHLRLLLSLAEVWQGEYYLLYVLLVPRQGKREPGRYQSPGPLTLEQVAAFCRRFAHFLQGDGRHHLWIGSAVNAGLLIYDQHDWIWAYGDLQAYISVLQASGFAEGEVVLPVPHSHNYHPTFDAAEDELAEFWEWSYFPLQPDDEY